MLKERSFNALPVLKFSIVEIRKHNTKLLVVGWKQEKNNKKNVPFERLKAENQTGGASLAFKSTETDECQSALNGNLKLR